MPESVPDENFIPDGRPEAFHVNGSVPDEVLNVYEYASPTAASGSASSVKSITGGCAFISSFNVFVTGLFSSSVARFSAVILTE